MAIKVKRSIQKSRLHKRQMEQRQRRVQFVLASFPDITLLESSNDPNKLPIGRLIGAVSQYISGFYESSILESSFAVEYGLLLKLNGILTFEKKQEIADRRRGLGLSEAIKLSKDVLIGKELAEELVSLNNLRDMSAHPSNWVTLLNQLGQMSLDQKSVERWITKVTSQSSKTIAERLKPEFNPDYARRAIDTIKSYKDERLGNLPDLEWATNKKTLRQQIEIVKKRSEKMVKDMIINKEVIKIINRPQDAAKYLLSKYRYPEESALQSIQTAYKTLKQLHILN